MVALPVSIPKQSFSDINVSIRRQRVAEAGSKLLLQAGPHKVCILSPRILNLCLHTDLIGYSAKELILQLGNPATPSGAGMKTAVQAIETIVKEREATKPFKIEIENIRLDNSRELYKYGPQVLSLVQSGRISQRHVTF